MIGRRLKDLSARAERQPELAQVVFGQTAQSVEVHLLGRKFGRILPEPEAIEPSLNAAHRDAAVAYPP